MSRERGRDGISYVKKPSALGKIEHIISAVRLSIALLELLCAAGKSPVGGSAIPAVGLTKRGQEK